MTGPENRLEPLKPKQARSRQRLEAILDAAEAEIARDGMARLTMSAVARAADIPIGSLYQYVPTMQALLRALADRFLDHWREQVSAELSGVGTAQELSAALVRIGRAIHVYLREHPQWREIWAHAHADPEIAAMDLEDSRANAAVIAEVLQHFKAPGPGEGRGQPVLDLLMFIQLSAGATLMAAGMDAEEGEYIVDRFIGIALREIGLPPAS